MKKRLLATTAAIAIMATPMAFAQDGNNQSMNDNTPIFSQEPYEGNSPEGGFYSAGENQVLATRFIGAYIYNGVGDEAETIGDVNDIIMTPDGRAVAVIAGVGGFLGIGEKEVAVSIDQLTWRTGEDGEMFLVGDFTEERLENAPEFDRQALMPGYNTANAQNDETMSDEQRIAEQEAGDEQMQDQQMAEQTPEDQQMTDEQMAENASDGSAMTGEQTDMETTASTENMETTPAGEAQFEASELIGMNVVGADQESIGEVSDVLVGDGGKIEAFVIDVGGFLGMNEKPVAVSMQDLQFARVQGSEDWTEIHTGLTKENLESQQAYTAEGYESDRDSVILVSPAE